MVFSITPTGNNVCFLEILLSNNVYDISDRVFVKLYITDRIFRAVVSLRYSMSNAARNVAPAAFGADSAMNGDGLICDLLTVLLGLRFVSRNVFVFVRADSGISRRRVDVSS